MLDATSRTDPGPSRIFRFTGPYSFLSNFYLVPTAFLGVMYPSLEHAYQASKTLDLEERRLIREAPTPGKAKYLGSPHGILTLRKDWIKLRDGIMYQLLDQKFRRGTSCYERLLYLTSTAELREGNTWHDNYWGDCICPRCKKIPGENKLGCMLMEIRELRRQGL